MKNLSRRSFLQNVSLGAGSAAAILTLPSSFSLYDSTPPDYDGKKLNIALCGLGRYSEILAKGLQTSQYCRIAGLVTGSLRKAENWKKRYAIPEKNIYNYRNFDEIIHNKDIDLVYVVLPNSMHKDFTIRSANGGKHVIVEKPMAISVEVCQEMINACKKAGVQLAVGYRLHTESYHLALKIRAGKSIGQVRLIEASLGYKSTDSTEWRLHKAISGGGPLMDIGIYCVQSCRHVTGEEPISVTAQLGPVTNKELFSEVEESITWQFEFPAALCPRPPVLTIVSSTDFFPLQMKDFSSSILLLVTDHIMENQAREN